MSDKSDIAKQPGDDCRLPAADGTAAFDPAKSFPGANLSSGVRFALQTLGSLFVALGIAGIVLPLVPTTPFLLAAAFCYARSSERHYNWLMNHKWFGEYIRNYQAGLGIPLKVKIFAITFLWLTIGSTAAFIIDIDWLRILLVCTALAVSLHISWMPTFRPERADQGS